MPVDFDPVWREWDAGNPNVPRRLIAPRGSATEGTDAGLKSVSDSRIRWCTSVRQYRGLCGPRHRQSNNTPTQRDSDI